MEALEPALRVLRQLRAVMVKEVRQTVRDRRMIFVMVLAPLVQLVLLSYAVNFDVDRVPTVVVDNDRTPASRSHLQRVAADGTLRVVAHTHDLARAERMIETGEAAVALVIAPGFARHLARREPAPVQAILDGGDSTRSNVAASAIARYFAAAGARGMPLRGAVLVPRVLYNPRLLTPPYMVPGVASMILLMVTTVLTAMGLARERETGTLEQVMVTPIGPATLLLGKLAPFVLIGVFDFLLAIAAGMTLFGVPLRGEVGFLLACVALYVVCTLGVGLMISSFSSNQQQAFLGAFLFMLPAILLSGTMSPVRSMPEWLQWVTLVNPLRHFIEIVRAVMLKGATFAEVQRQVAALAAFAVTVFTVAALRFRKQLG
ncbi:MAG: ABC transporter permease [Polyangiales bacterium]